MQLFNPLQIERPLPERNNGPRVGDVLEVAHDVVLFIYFRLVVLIASSELVGDTDGTSTVMRSFSKLSTSDEVIDIEVPSPAQANQPETQPSPTITAGSAFIRMPTTPPHTAQSLTPNAKTSTALILSRLTPEAPQTASYLVTALVPRLIPNLIPAS